MQTTQEDEILVVVKQPRKRRTQAEMEAARLLAEQEEIVRKPRKRRTQAEIEEARKIIVPTEDTEDTEEEVDTEDTEVKTEVDDEKTDELVVRHKNKFKKSNMILKFQFEISDVIIDEDVNKLLYIPSFKDLNPIVVGNILAENAQLEARWNVLYNEAVAEYEKKELDIDIAKAKQDLDIRTRALQNNDKMTETKITNMIIRDPKYKKIQQELIEIKRKMNNLKSVAQAFVSRGNKTITLAHLVNSEMKLSNNTNLI